MNRFGLTSVYSSENNDYSYTVKAGDSLYKISKELGININDLISANNLTNNLIYPNQVLVVPRHIQTGAMYFEEYIVKPDDTLELILEKNNISVNELGKYNDLTKLILVENQVINIPRFLSKYVIKADDTIDSILDQVDMTFDELIEANLLEWLKAGNIIYVKKESE